jgi:hypothetical protein
LAFAEAKGFATMDYKIKLKVFRKNRSEKLYIYTGDYRRPRLAEVVNG